MISKEAQIVLLCSSTQHTEKELDLIQKLVSVDVDWGEFLYLCTHHRVIPLVWRTLSELSLLDIVENHVRRVMKNVVDSIAYQNNKVYQEMKSIVEELHYQKIPYVALKGLYLSSFIYGDVSLRQFGDVDFLVDEADLDRVTGVLIKYGYEQGKINVNNNTIKSVSRQEKLHRRINTHEIVEFVKLTDDSLCPYYMIDVNFSLTWKASGSDYSVATNDFLKTAIQVKNELIEINVLPYEYQIIQLCMHLYSEAVYFCWHTNWMRDKSDLNLIKFCDIHELVKQYPVDWNKILLITEKHKIHKPVYYSLYLTNELFPNFIPKDIIDSIGCKAEIINQYYDKHGNVHYWNMNFMDRMFEINKKVQEIQQCSGIL